MSRSQIKSDLPVEIADRVKNIDSIYKIVHTKLTPISKSYPLVSSDAPRLQMLHVLKYFLLMMLF
jgi:hypothetical protein